MTSLTTVTTVSPVTPVKKESPRQTSGEKPSSTSTGMGNGDSSFSAVNTNTPETREIRPSLTSTEEKPPNLNPPTSTNLITNSTSKSKGSLDPEPRSSSIGGADVTIPMIISTIFQRFLVRMPHTFIAMAGVFVPLYYGLDKESLAISATTFVGVGGTVYCFVRAFFLETIPLWMLPNNNDTKIWRRLMNITYTGFITAMFTTAVWKLPDLTTAQGFAFLTASFVAPYPLLAKLYPDIDKQPSPFERKYNTKL
jgi:hypothetical protein